MRLVTVDLDLPDSDEGGTIDETDTYTEGSPWAHEALATVAAVNENPAYDGLELLKITPPSTLVIQDRSDFGWPATTAPSAPCTNGMVAHYNGPATGLNGKAHSAHIDYWNRTRDFHIHGNGWLDIGYSFGVCPCGIALEGRGFGHSQAAQPGGNTTWTSCTFGIGGTESPTDAALQGWRLLRYWLRGKHGVGSAIRPHQAFVSTDCPGVKILGLLNSGALAQAPSGGTPPPPAPKPVKAPAFPLPAGHWYGPESSDPHNHSGYWAADRPNITKFKTRLKTRGWIIDTGGRVDSADAKVVKAFQAEKGLHVDGLVGPITWRAIWEAKIT